jgi:hypothetical protein
MSVFYRVSFSSESQTDFDVSFLSRFFSVSQRWEFDPVEKHHEKTFYKKSCREWRIEKPFLSSSFDHFFERLSVCDGSKKTRQTTRDLGKNLTSSSFLAFDPPNSPRATRVTEFFRRSLGPWLI